MRRVDEDYWVTVTMKRPTVPEKPPTVATVRETDPEEPRAIVRPTGAMEGTSW